MRGSFPSRRIATPIPAAASVSCVSASLSFGLSLSRLSRWMAFFQAVRSSCCVGRPCCKSRRVAITLLPMSSCTRIFMLRISSSRVTAATSAERRRRRLPCSASSMLFCSSSFCFSYRTVTFEAMTCVYCAPSAAQTASSEKRQTLPSSKRKRFCSRVPCIGPRSISVRSS